jgi:hypothetical protein
MFSARVIGHVSNIDMLKAKVGMSGTNAVDTPLHGRLMDLKTDICPFLRNEFNQREGDEPATASDIEDFLFRLKFSDQFEIRQVFRSGAFEIAEWADIFPEMDGWEVPFVI